jgi:hypothetical protein
MKHAIFVALVVDALAALYPSAQIDPTRRYTLEELVQRMDTAGLLVDPLDD